MVFNYIYTIVLVSIESVVTENCKRNRNRKQKTENLHIFILEIAVLCPFENVYNMCGRRGGENCIGTQYV